MAEAKIDSGNPGMMMVITFGALLVINSLVISFANYFFPDWVVLGTLAFTATWATFHSMLLLALIGTFVLPFIRQYEIKRGKMFSTQEWMIAYFVINLVGVWVIARFSEQFGLGIRSWLVAVVLAVVLDFLQGVVMMKLEKLRSKFS